MPAFVEPLVASRPRIGLRGIDSPVMADLEAGAGLCAPR